MQLTVGSRYVTRLELEVALKGDDVSFYDQTNNMNITFQIKMKE